MLFIFITILLFYFILFIYLFIYLLFFLFFLTFLKDNYSLFIITVHFLYFVFYNCLKAIIVFYVLLLDLISLHFLICTRLFLIITTYDLFQFLAPATCLSQSCLTNVELISC